MNKQEIEKLAYELKCENMNEVQRIKKSGKLAAALKELSFVEEDSNVELMTALNSSLNRYGKTVDATTNEVVPFLQLFAHDYNLKKPDIVKARFEEKYGVNQNLRRQRIVDVIRIIQENHNISRLDINFNPLNFEKVKDVLNKMGATKEESAWVETIFNEATVIADCEFENENTDKVTVRPSDPVSLDSYDNAERTFDAVIDGVENVMAGVDKKKARKFATWFVTMKARNYENKHGFAVEIEKFVDKDLLNFCEVNGSASEVDIRTSYTGLKRDTVRKSWKEAEKLFKKSKYGRAA